MKALKYLLPLSIMLTAGNALAEDMDGEKLFKGKGCVSCHGEAGIAPIMATYPKLGGQSAPYLVAKLKSYKAGEIKGAASALMTPMAAMLSEDEMDAVAAYLESAAEIKAAEAE